MTLTLLLIFGSMFLFLNLKKKKLKRKVVVWKSLLVINIYSPSCYLEILSQSEDGILTVGFHPLSLQPSSWRTNVSLSHSNDTAISSCYYSMGTTKTLILSMSFTKTWIWKVLLPVETCEIVKEITLPKIWQKFSPDEIIHVTMPYWT